jgi:large subunit ribosomal protein L3
MAIGIIGRKCGMTRVFTEQGESVPVTVIEATTNRVAQVKTEEKEGYRALQVTFGGKRANLVNKPEGEGLWELRIAADEGGDLEPGAELGVDQFEAGQKVDVTGTTKGKGFAGTVKRHNFRMQDATHGNSLSHRAPGSIGQCQTPGRVFKGKKMAGQMGNERATTQNLEIMRVDTERNLLLVKGAVPGAAGGHVTVRPAVKVH